MARAKRGFKRRRRVKKIKDMSEGFMLGAGGSIFRRTMEAVDRAGVYAYRDRRVKKREFRKLWITRISAACANWDMSYSRFMSALTKSSVQLNRKWLSEIAIEDPKAFGMIVDQVRANAPAN